MEDLKETITKIETAMAQAFNRRDVDAILQHFDENVVGFSSTKHERLWGLEAMRKTFAYFIDPSEKVVFQPDEIEVREYGQVVIATFYWVATVYSGKQQREVHGRGSHVFVNRNGQWKIVNEHFSRAHHPPELWDSSPG